MLEIINLTSTKVDQKWLRGVARKSLQVLGLEDKDSLISLVLVGEARIRQLNKIWRGRNQATDVLAFSYDRHAFVCTPDKRRKSGHAFIVPKKFQDFLGEIFICLPKAKKQAKKFSHSLKNELTLLLVHGILHLVGYEDEGTAKERERIREMEKKIMNKLT